jgi:hypothetical protein
VIQILTILWNACGLPGLLSAAASVAVVPLLAAGLGRRGRFRAWLAAAVIAALATVLAVVTSWSVRAIEVDRSAEVLAAEAAGARAVQDKFRDRAARVRFAEDTAADQADVAGVSAAEEAGAYERAVATELEKIPAYRLGGRKERSGRKRADDTEPSAAAEVGGWGEVPDGGGEDAGAVDERAVRVLPEAELLVVDRFDRLNRWLAWSLLSLTVGLVGCEWVRRFNTAFDVIWPLPLAGTAVDGLLGKQHLVSMPPQACGTVAAWLESITRKGESFLLFAPEDPLADVTALPRFALGPVRWQVPVRHFSACQLVADPGLAEIVFESAWFGRASCVIEGPDAAGDLLARFAAIMAGRRHCRARARRTVTIVWLLPCDPPPEPWAEMDRLAAATNVRWVRPAPQSG